MPVTMAGRPDIVKPGAAQCALALACASVLAAKFWLIWRLNINWDEFFFLTQVHAAARGELTQALQTSFTHFFAWLPRLPGYEIEQIHAARVLMVILLGVSALLIQRLAARWFPPVAAWTAALTFLAMWPTLKHGGSFRSDSLLLPLQLGALVVLTSPGLKCRGRGIGAGVLLGLATAVSIKAVLIAPVVVVIGVAEPGGWRIGIRRLAWLAGAALVTVLVVVGAHLLTVSGQNAVATAGTMAGAAWGKTLRDVPWFPQADTLREMLQEDRIVWVAAVCGLGYAVWRQRWAAAACALALLPIAFYRNSYPYFYVVMWAPVCVLIAAAVAGTHEIVSRHSRPTIASALTFALTLLLGTQGLRDLAFLSHARQEAQSQLVAAVHAIFPEPVPYIDHSGMIASFRKVNFFMSTWGVEGYVARGRPFMARAIDRFRPPLLIANRAVLRPGSGNFNELLREDREIIEQLYQPYWGSIRIAGAAATVEGGGTATLVLPFAGRYRLESPVSLRIGGALYLPGQVVPVGEQGMPLEVTVEAAVAIQEPLLVRLLWADAQLPPSSAPVSLVYYDGL